MLFLAVVDTGRFVGPSQVQESAAGHVLSTSPGWLKAEIWLLVIYKKAVKENIPAHILKSIREVLENE